MKKLVMMLAVAVAFIGTLFICKTVSKAEEVELIVNGSFENADVSMWQAAQGSAEISAVESENGAFYDEVKNAGVIRNRTAAYECFAQDLTGKVVAGKKYTFSFYACLSEDYKDAPANQRVVEFSPYYTVGGQTSYLGSWSTELSGSVSQTLTPGEWVKYSGTLEIPGADTIDEFVIRIIEQGTEYGQGECVLGDYYVAGVSMTCEETAENEASESSSDEMLIDTTVTPLRDAVCEAMGEDAIVGCAVTLGEIKDKGVEQIVEYHFNAFTIGNELKPDAMFGYSNNKCPGTEEVQLNGETITVPKMDYSRAEQILNIIVKWNDEHPDRFVKVRGHVLVWHAQTPEWFFHVDYDASKDYVTPAEMSKRLEWYIKTMMEHFTGPDSKYKGLFYGWDVVNEAISDGTHTYRSDAENPSESLSQATHGSNSSWWHVYQSNQYIIEAFRYANKYAPAELDLYYNDYNECDILKQKGIIQLLEDVKNADGTRITGMGMQGHYSAAEMMQDKFEMAARKYGAVVDKVMITEWDLKSNGNYDGSDESKVTEYTNQGHKYEMVYNRMLELIEEGTNIAGFTFWGTVDKYSWLQSSNNVGGASDGKNLQCPLLFDDDYNIKPAYWAFVDASHINDMTKAWQESKKAETEETEETEEPETTVEETSDTEADTSVADAADNTDAAEETTPEVSAKSHTPKLGAIFTLAGLAIVVYVLTELRKKKKK